MDLGKIELKWVATKTFATISVLLFLFSFGIKPILHRVNDHSMDHVIAYTTVGFYISMSLAISYFISILSIIIRLIIDDIKDDKKKIN